MPDNDIAVAMYTFTEFQRDLAKTPEYQHLLRCSDSDAMRVFSRNAMSHLGHAVTTRNGEPTIMRYPVTERFHAPRFDGIRNVLRIELGKLTESKTIIEMHFQRASRGILSQAISDARNHKEVEDRIQRTPEQIRLQSDYQRRQSDIRKAVAWVAGASNTFDNLGFDGTLLPPMFIQVSKKFTDRFYPGAYQRRYEQAELQAQQEQAAECTLRRMASVERMERAFSDATEKDLFVTHTSEFIKSQAGNIGGHSRWGGADNVIDEFYGGLAIGGYLHRYTLALGYSLKAQAIRNPMRWYDIAAFMMIGIIRAHPYLDGNGRTARSLYGIILIKNNMPFIAPERVWQQNQIHNTNIDVPAKEHPLVIHAEV